MRHAGPVDLASAPSESLVTLSPLGASIGSLICPLLKRPLQQGSLALLGRLKTPTMEAIRYLLGKQKACISVLVGLFLRSLCAQFGVQSWRENQKIGEKFTEFYFLGQEGREGSYPRQLIVGEEGRVVVGIANNEYKIINYWVEVRINGVKNNEVEGISLKHGERWENEVSFTPTVAGVKQKIEFLLYEEGEATALFEPLRLWVDIVE